MKLLAKVLLAFGLLVTVAEASCPPSMPYNCVQQPNGKMRCGCGVM